MGVKFSMAKRFTDNEKWNQSWFRKLTPTMKAAWIFLCDKCDQAGVWSIDMDSMSFHVGENITLASLLSSFNSDKEDRVILLRKDLILISGFISFQYGTLSQDCKPHKPIFALLEKHNLSKGYPKGIDTLQEKEKEKDKEKDQEQDQETEKEISFNFEEISKNYPRNGDRAEGIARLKDLIKSQEDFNALTKAVSNYAKHCELNETEEKFIKQFTTFVGTKKVQRWKDYVNFTPKREFKAANNKQSSPPANERTESLEELFGGKL